MHQYLVGQGYWSYVEGANENQPNPTHADYPTWEQATSHVLYCLASCIHDHLLNYIQEAKTPKEVWGEPQEDFRGQHDRKKASTPSRVERYTTEGHVNRQLHLEDQGVV